MPNLVQLLCILPALRLALAVRGWDEGEKAVITLRKPEDEFDAVSQPCTSNAKTASIQNSLATKHNFLGNYTAQELMESRCDEILLVLLSRMLQKIKRMSELLPATKSDWHEGYPKNYFYEKFPVDYSRNTKNLNLFQNAAEAGLTLATLGASKVFDLGVNIGLDAYTAGSYAEWLKQDLADPTAEATTLLIKGGGLPTTPMWKDVPIGTLEDVKRIVKRRWRAMRCETAIIPHATKLHLSETHTESIPAATFVKKLQPVGGNDFDHTFTRIEISNENLPSNTMRGWKGWVKDSDIAPSVWYQNVAKVRLPLCQEAKYPCPPDFIKGYVEMDEMVRVLQPYGLEQLGWFWSTCGEDWYIPADPKLMTGPLEREDAEFAQELIEKSLNVDHLAVKEGRIISQFSEKWNSKVATHAKVAASVGLIVGGILSHGLLFLIAGMAYGLGSAGVDSEITHKKIELTLEQVSYVMLSLLHLERELFEKKGNGHVSCDATSEKRPLCDKGFTCLRKGIFMNEHASPHGWCVLSPWKELVKDGEECATSMDCESGECELNNHHEHTLIHMMSGYCRQFKS